MSHQNITTTTPTTTTSNNHNIHHVDDHSLLDNQWKQLCNGLILAHANSVHLNNNNNDTSSITQQQQQQLQISQSIQSFLLENERQMVQLILHQTVQSHTIPLLNHLFSLLLLWLSSPSPPSLATSTTTTTTTSSTTLLIHTIAQLISIYDVDDDNDSNSEKNHHHHHQLLIVDWLLPIMSNPSSLLNTLMTHKNRVIHACLLILKQYIVLLTTHQQQSSSSSSSTSLISQHLFSSIMNACRDVLDDCSSIHQNHSATAASTIATIATNVPHVSPSTPITTTTTATTTPHTTLVPNSDMILEQTMEVMQLIVHYHHHHYSHPTTRTTTTTISTNSTTTELPSSLINDVMDVLVGWYLDRDTSIRLRNLISQCFTHTIKPLMIHSSVHHHHHHHHSIVLHLLDQLLNDMKNSTEEKPYQLFVSCFTMLIPLLIGGSSSSSSHITDTTHNDTNDTTSSTNSSSSSSTNSSIHLLIHRLLNVFIQSLDKFTDKHRKIWKSTSECILAIAKTHLLFLPLSSSSSSPSLSSSLSQQTSVHHHHHHYQHSHHHYHYHHLTSCMEYYGKVLKQSTKFELSLDWFDSVVQLLNIVLSSQSSTNITGGSGGGAMMVVQFHHFTPLMSSIVSFVQMIQNTNSDVHLQFGKIYHLVVQSLLVLPSSTSSSATTTTTTTTTQNMNHGGEFNNSAVAVDNRSIIVDHDCPSLEQLLSFMMNEIPSLIVKNKNNKTNKKRKKLQMRSSKKQLHDGRMDQQSDDDDDDDKDDDDENVHDSDEDHDAVDVNGKNSKNSIHHVESSEDIGGIIDYAQWNHTTQLIVTFQLSMLNYVISLFMKSHLTTSHKYAYQLTQCIMNRYQDWMPLIYLSPTLYYLFVKNLSSQHTQLLSLLLSSASHADHHEDENVSVMRNQLSLIHQLCHMMMGHNSRNSDALPCEIKMVLLSWIHSIIVTCSSHHQSFTTDSNSFVKTLLKMTNDNVHNNPRIGEETTTGIVDQRSPLFKLLSCLLSNDPHVQVRSMAVQLTSSMIQGMFTQTINESLSQCRDACLFQLMNLLFMSIGDRNESVWQTSIREMSHFAPLLMDSVLWNNFKLYRTNQSSCEPDASQSMIALQQQQQYMNSVLFKSDDFLKLFQFFTGDHSPSDGSHTLEHFDRMYQLIPSHLLMMTNRQPYQTNNSMITNEIVFDQWIIHEATRYCLFHRFRTSFGNAVQTFEQFESVLKGMIHEQKQLKGQTNVSHALTRRISLFVDFLNELEKQLTLVIDGLKLSEYPANVHTFFQANAKVCQDWFSRLRPLIVKVSMTTRTATTSQIRNTLSGLSELKNQLLNNIGHPSVFIRGYNELETILIDLCVTLSLNGDSDMIVGLLATLKHIIDQLDSNSYTHVQQRAMLLESALHGTLNQGCGRYERAIEYYESAIKVSPSETALSEYTRMIVINQLLNCYGYCDESQLSSQRDSHSSSFVHNSVKYEQVLSEFDTVGRNTSMKDELSLHKVSGCLLEQKRLLDSDCSSFSVTLPFRSELLSMARATSNEIGSYFALMHLSSLVTNQPAPKREEDVVPFETADYLFSRVTSDHKTKLFYLNQKSQLMTKKMITSDPSLLVVQSEVNRALHNFNACEVVLDNMEKLYDAQKRIKKSASDFDLVKVHYERALLLHDRDADRVRGIECLCKAIRLCNDHPSTAAQHQHQLSRMLVQLYDWSSNNSNVNSEDVHQLIISSCGIHKTEQATSNDITTRGEDLLREVLLKAVAVDPHDRTSLVKYARWCQSQDMIEEAIVYYLKSLQQQFNGTDPANAIRELNVNIVLQLLRFFTDYKRCVSLLENESIMAAIDSTAAFVWFDIIPQILSHIGDLQRLEKEDAPTADAIKRNNVIKKLLVKIGKERPQLVVYPIIVGTRCNPSDESTTGRMYREILFEIVTCSPSSHARMFDGVELFVNELSRITLLREERWMNAIPILVRRLEKALDIVRSLPTAAINDASSQQESPSLLVDNAWSSYVQTVSDVLTSIEQLFEDTSSAPETKQEYIFQDKYEPIISSCVNSLRSEHIHLDSISYSKQATEKTTKSISMVIRQLNQLHKIFTHNMYYTVSGHKMNGRKTGGGGILKLNNISPTLASMKDIRFVQYHNSIPMPGSSDIDTIQEASSSNPSVTNGIVTVSSLKDMIQIVASKTKPKRFSVFGSDGKLYTYLLKGREDLHLDERIMQFLRVVNISLLSSGSDNRFLRARHYSVVPLGERSGLIRWVDGAQPIFSLHRKWYLNKQVVEQRQAGAQPTSTLQPFRPVDMYCEKLVAALKEAGIKKAVHPYPAEVLKKVYAQMVSTIPSDLLSKELWLKSENLNEWWDKSRSFSRSLAVMSMIGYVIGLGDRHLDNILLDTSSGEIVHIDYNVCFDKGLLLKVPEVVPFRMTPVLHDALGLTGVEGTFRMTCEKTLNVMKQSKQTLLMLLEAFIYDPLVDWQTPSTVVTRDNHTIHQSSDEMDEVASSGSKTTEHKVALRLCASRMEEIRPQLKKVFHNFEEQLDHNRSSYTKWVEYLQNQSGLIFKFSSMEKPLSMNKESHASIEIHSTTSSVTEDQEIMVNQQVALLEGELKKYSDISESHNKIFESVVAVDANSLAACTTINPALLHSPNPQIAHVMPFIHQVIPPQLITLSQYQLLESQVMNQVNTFNMNVQQLIDTFLQYRSHISLFSFMEFMQSDKSYIWSSYLQQVLIDPTLVNIDQMLEKFASLSSRENMLKTIQSIQSFSNQSKRLSSILESCQEKLDHCLARVQYLDKDRQESFELFVTFNHQFSSSQQIIPDILRFVLGSISSELTSTIERGGDNSGIIASGENNTKELALDCKALRQLSNIASKLKVLKEVQPHLTRRPISVPLQPSAAQIDLLTDTLYQLISSVMDLLNKFRRILLPETQSAIQSGHTTVLHELESMIQLSTRWKQQQQQQQPHNRTSIMTQYQQQVSLDQSNPSSILLAAYDSLFVACEKQFRELSTVDSVALEQILFDSKLTTIGALLETIMEHSQQHSHHHDDRNEELSMYQICINAIQQGYVNVLIQQVSLRTLSSLLNTWNDRFAESIASFSEQEQSLFGKLDAVILQQQEYDWEKIEVQWLHMHQSFIQHSLDSVHKELTKFVWSSCYYDQIPEVLECNDNNNNLVSTIISGLVQSKHHIMNQLQLQVNSLSVLVAQMSASVSSYMSIEYQILSMCISLSTSIGLSQDQLTVLSNNWQEKKLVIESCILSTMSPVSSFIELCKQVITMEQSIYRRASLTPHSHSHTTEDKSSHPPHHESSEEESQLIDLIEGWRSVINQFSLIQKQAYHDKNYRRAYDQLLVRYKNISGTFQLLANKWLSEWRMFLGDIGRQYCELLTEIEQSMEGLDMTEKKLPPSASSSFVNNTVPPPPSPPQQQQQEVQEYDKAGQQFVESSSKNTITSAVNSLQSTIHNQLKLLDQLGHLLNEQERKLQSLVSQRQQHQQPVIVIEDQPMDSQVIQDLFSCKSFVMSSFETMIVSCAQAHKNIQAQMDQILQMVGNVTSDEEIYSLRSNESIEEQLSVAVNNVYGESSNAYAMDVLLRVAQRLEDRRTVSEQVEFVIAQATSIDNLSSMYEGWCAFC